MSQEVAAARLGVSRSTMIRAENGESVTERSARRIQETLAALESSEITPQSTPRQALDQIVNVGGSPSLMIREFQAFVESLPTVDDQWRAVRTFAILVASLEQRRRE